MLPLFNVLSTRSLFWGSLPFALLYIHFIPLYRSPRQYARFLRGSTFLASDSQSPTSRGGMQGTTPVWSMHMAGANCWGWSALMARPQPRFGFSFLVIWQRAEPA